ncbi:MAG: hypothetical protein ACI4RJ_01760 [Alphaproteobacteria bacterium]
MEETTENQQEQAQEPNLYQEQTQTQEPFPQAAEQQFQQQLEQEAATNQTNQPTSPVGYDQDGILTLESFQAGFISAFDVAGDITGLKSFPVKEYERAGALKTAEKLYSIALKYPAFRFLVDRRSYWLYDWSLIAGFVAMKTNDVMEEKFNVSIKSKLFGWLKWNKSEKTANGSGFLARLVRVKQPKQDS